MAITTYSELKSAVADWLNRDDLTSVVPSFISLAEAQFQRDVRHLKMMQRSRAPIDARYSAVPPQWVETIRLHLTGGSAQQLEFTTLDQMLEMRQANADLQGRPRFYTHVGETIEVYPTPDAVYDAELLYYERIPALSDASPTNWLLTAAPDIYLYGSLLQSAPYLKDDARTGVWAPLYAGAVASLNAANNRAQNSGAAFRMKFRSY